MNARSSLVHALLLSACVVAAGVGAPEAQIARAPASKQRPVPYRAYRDAGGRFTIEHPVRDWRVLPAMGAALLSVAEKDFEATLSIEYQRLEIPLEPSSLTTHFGQIEVEAIQSRSPGLKDFEHQIVDAPGGRGALIRYLKAGIRGPEQVVQFSLPSQLDLYRITGTYRASMAAKYDPIIAHMIESFAVLRSPDAVKP